MCHLHALQAVSPAADPDPRDVEAGTATGKRAAQHEAADESDNELSGVKERGLRKPAEGNVPPQKEAEPSIAGAEAQETQKPKGRKVRFWPQDIHMCLSRRCTPEAACESCPCC